MGRGAYIVGMSEICPPLPASHVPWIGVVNIGVLQCLAPEVETKSTVAVRLNGAIWVGTARERPPAGNYSVMFDCTITPEEVRSALRAYGATVTEA